MSKCVIKRNGTKEIFDESKIYDSIRKAAEAIKAPMPNVKIEINNDVSSVEYILDVVIKTLYANGYSEVADSFASYRERRRKERGVYKNLMRNVSEISCKDAKDVNLSRENGNIDGNTAMGQMLRFGSETAKAYYLTNCISPEISQAHINGDIHIHDLDFYGMTTTCTQIDIKSLLARGYNTGHGFIRPPKSIKTAANLACIAIQANQNDQHGGQSIPNFDRGLAPYVDVSLNKYYKDYLIDFFKENDTENIAIGCAECIESHKYVENNKELNIEHEIDFIKENESILNVIKNEDKTVELTYDIVSKKIYDVQKNCFIKACDSVEKETYQAMEAVIHNLNTMHSRAGSQVPFSSINYGTDTSDSGRLIVKSVLLATDAGLGDGETPIFPIQIFRLKSGINYEKNDKNYDLFELALKVSAKRMFPNFSFQDSWFNAQYYDENRNETEIAYMGAVLGASVITVKHEDKIEVLSFENAYNKYHDKENVLIYDSSVSDFVKIKTWINNPDGGDWYKVKFSDGRVIVLTSDHPLPTQRGRVECRDLCVGDRVHFSAVPKNVCDDNIKPEIDPWLLGVIVCDARYNTNMVVSLGLDEMDIVEKIKNVYENVNVKKVERGQKGNYIDVTIYASDYINRKKLESILGGPQKIKRNLPCDFLMWSHSDRLNLLCGIIDADGYINTNKGCTVNIGSTNKVLAFEELLLAESLGMNASIYENHYSKEDQSKIRYLISFQAPDYLPIVCEKKKIKLNKSRSINERLDTCEIKSIEFLGSLGERRYDVESESDRFDVDGINSHNCRTRVVGNVCDKDNEITYSRGNLSFTSINLPRLAIKQVNERGKLELGNLIELEKFENDFIRPVMELVKNQLIERFKLQCSRKVKNFPFLMKQGVWLDSEKLSNNDTLEKVLKHGTLSIGFIGLAETLKELYGVHHGESNKAQEAGIHIIKYMRDFVDNASKELQLNFTLLATPAEGLCLAGDTLVQTLNGHKEIKKLKEGDYVLSYNEETHLTEPDKIIKAGKTFSRAEVYEVEFDTGQKVICTAEHPFGVRVRYRDNIGRATSKNGFFETIQWKQANELVPGDRVKSCYWRIQRNGYLQLTNEERYIHKIVYEHFNGPLMPNIQVHHKDEDKMNNNPENLIGITRLEHKKHHAYIGELCKHSFKKGENSGSKNPFYGKKFTTDMRVKAAKTKAEKRALLANDYELLLKEYRQGEPEATIAERYGVSVKSYKEVISRLLDYENSDEGYFKLSLERNHKVVSVKKLTKKIAVYDITTEKNHNFYIGGDKGILVHNSGRFVRMDKKTYGEIDGVTDKGFYTNSFHVPVEYKTTASHKIDIEAPYHALTNAGHISYIEFDGDVSSNIEAMKKVVKYMGEKQMGYAAINHPIDYDPECGYRGVIDETCPKCGRKESQDKPFERIRRITGYLVGTLDRFNDAKREEESMRVKHNL